MLTRRLAVWSTGKSGFDSGRGRTHRVYTDSGYRTHCRWSSKCWDLRSATLPHLATGYGLDDRRVGVRVPVGSKNCFIFRVAHTGSGAHPSAYPMDISPEIKRPGREAEYSPPTSAEVKKI
jgi:hypothetical protein